MPALIGLIICAITMAFSCIGMVKSDYDTYKEGNVTDYEITINDEKVYICEDYKIPNTDYTIEYVYLGENERDDYILFYKDGNETISSDTVNNFKVKEIKVNREPVDFKDYASAQLKRER